MKISVPDLPSPTALLCWQQDRATMERCDRQAGHAGPHVWDLDGYAVLIAKRAAQETQWAAERALRITP